MDQINKKVKVLHIITRFICGGADENTLLTVNGLDKNRYEVHLMIGKTYEDKMIAQLSPDIRLIKIPEMGREISPLKDLAALFHIYRIMNSERYDIIHTHTSKAGFIGRLAAKLSHSGHVVHGVHTIPFADILQPQYNRLFLGLERFAARFTDIFISVGEDLMTRYIEAGVGEIGKYHVVYSGMNIGHFEKALLMGSEEKGNIRKEMGVTDNALCIGIVSRLEPGKGFNFFSSIVSRIVAHNGDIRFVVVGDGSLRSQLVNEMREKNLEKNVVFVGFRDDIANVMGGGGGSI